MGKKGYWLMDARANYSVDDAIVFECCHSLKEARKHINDYGEETCIVDVETQTVIESSVKGNVKP